MIFTILGSSGFIGRHLTATLKAAGHEVRTPVREDILSSSGNQGHVIYAIGLTGDYRQKPLGTVEAHAGLASRFLQQASFESFLYLSSTRVYRGLSANDTAKEDMAIPMQVSGDTTYDYSKLLGESLCLSDTRSSVRIARLSNVYGEGMSEGSFLGSVTASLHRTKSVTIDDHADSAKDYISIRDVTRLLAAIATSGKQRIYNVASGQPISNRQITDVLTASGYSVNFSGKTTAPRIFPTIDTTRLRHEFPPAQNTLLVDLPALTR